jgi:hypothetical protein
MCRCPRPPSLRRCPASARGGATARARRGEAVPARGGEAVEAA